MIPPELEDESIDDGDRKSKGGVGEVHADASRVPHRPCELEPACFGWCKKVLQVVPGVESILASSNSRDLKSSCRPRHRRYSKLSLKTPTLPRTPTIPLPMLKKMSPILMNLRTYLSPPRF